VHLTYQGIIAYQVHKARPAMHFTHFISLHLPLSVCLSVCVHICAYWHCLVCIHH